MNLVLGIDVGVAGGIAVLSDCGELIAVHDMPVLKDGKSHADHAFVEHVSARPGEGAVGAFSFGRARGVIEGVLAADGLPCKFLTAPAWKRAVGLQPGRDKDASRAEAIRRWPARADLFARKKDDGKAEACLIAIAGIVRERAP